MFTDVTGPGGMPFLPVGVNNQGQLVGMFAGGVVSYLATPQGASTAVPEPGTAALVCSFLVLGTLSRWRGAHWL